MTHAQHADPRRLCEPVRAAGTGGRPSVQRLANLLLAANLWACSSDGAQPQAAALAPPPQRARVVESAPRDDRFDGSGQLQSSGRRASWLELPRGFRERADSTARLFAYEAQDLPLGKAREYLAARLRSERVEYPPGGVIFHAARPTYTQLPMPALEVRLIELRGSSQTLALWVEELPPENVPKLPVDVAAKELARMRSRLE